MKTQFDRMRCAQLRAKIGPVVGIGRQAVVHMHGTQFKGMAVAQAQHDMQQGHRVESAREPQHQPRAGRNGADQRVRHDRCDRLIWQGFP